LATAAVINIMVGDQWVIHFLES